MKVPSNLLRDIKQYYYNELYVLYGEQETLSMLNLLIQHFYGLSRADQSLQPDFRLTETEMLKLHFAVKKLKKEEPIQYLIGETEFAGLTIQVNTDVLIPRPETEELVEKIISENSEKNNLTLLDIGTGSGCIALSLKKRLPQSTVVAIDVSAEALAVAAQNKDLNNLDVSFVQLDILNKNTRNTLGMYNLIVSNPPYVTETDKRQMQNNVINYEPHLALFVTDDDPLLFYREIAEFALSHLKEKGSLWFEINEALADEVIGFLESKAYGTIELHNDVHNKARFVSCVK